VSLIRREPAAIAGLVAAVLALLLAFGVKVSTGQEGAISAVVSAVLALFVRSQVSPTGG